ncbi:MAG: hypothetical protein ACXVB9_03960 [Bdellovibrionota bacterium]
MIKAITRTVGVFGTIFLAGYVAKRYFGWDTDALLDTAKDKLNTLQSKTDFKAKHALKDTSQRAAM